MDSCFRLPTLPTGRQAQAGRNDIFRGSLKAKIKDKDKDKVK